MTPSSQHSHAGTAKPRVVFVDHSGLPGGGQLGLLRYAQQTRSVDPYVIQLGGGSVFTGALEPGRVEVLSESTKKWAYFRLAGRLSRKIDELNADIVIANSAKAASLLAFTRGNPTRPWVFYLRDDFGPKRNSLGKRLFFATLVLPRFDGYVANSQWTASTLPRRLRKKRLAIAHPVSGVTPSTAEPVQHSPFQLLTLSRLDHWKGIHEVLNAIAHLESRGYGGTLELTIAGGSAHADTEYASALMAAASALRTPVRFVGHVSDVRPLLTSSDCLVAVSLSPEPFGQVVAQGMAAGLAVIAGNEGGPTEIMTHMKDGLLVTPGDASELAQSIAMLIDQRDLTLGIRRAARLAAADLSDEMTVAQLDSAILGHLAARHGPEVKIPEGGA